jgi:hypothetical protein
LQLKALQLVLLLVVPVHQLGQKLVMLLLLLR